MATLLEILEIFNNYMSTLCNIYKFFLLSRFCCTFVLCGLTVLAFFSIILIDGVSYCFFPPVCSNFPVELAHDASCLVKTCWVIMMMMMMKLVVVDFERRRRRRRPRLFRP